MAKKFQKSNYDFKKTNSSKLSCHYSGMQPNNRVLYREGLHILMNTRLIKLILAKQVVEIKNTLNYLRTGPKGVAIAMRHQESIKLRSSRRVK